MQLCARCILPATCQRLTSRACTRSELSPSFVRDIRAYAYELNLSADHWKDFLVDSYRDYVGRIVGADGYEVCLDTGVFDAIHIRTWFRDFACTPLAADACPRLHERNIPRILVMASILRAIDPVRTSLWGRPAANDEYEDTRFWRPELWDGACPF